MLYTKKDLPRLEKQSKDPNLGYTVQQYYKRCIAEINDSKKVDTKDVRDDGDE